MPVSGHHPSEKKVLCVSAELPTKSFNRPPVTKGGTTAPCPKAHRPIRDAGKPSARDVLLRGLDVRLSGECATSELSGRCVGVLTALPDPTKRQSRLSITRLCLDPGSRAPPAPPASAPKNHCGYAMAHAFLENGRFRLLRCWRRGLLAPHNHEVQEPTAQGAQGGDRRLHCRATSIGPSRR